MADKRRAIRGALGRRAVLAACLALLARRGAAAGSFVDGAHVLVAGSPGGQLDRFADDLLPALARFLPGELALHRDLVGAPDGVTGANRFQARGVPDGASLLLAPGEAVLCWLVGDPRTHFDASTLVPVMAGVAPGVLMSRHPLEQIAVAAHLRIAAERPEGADLAGLLGLDLLGLRPEPVFGPADSAAVEQVILAHGADAAFVVGPDAPQRVARLARAGLAPMFTLGVPGDGKDVLRDPLMPEVPTLPELVARFHGTPPAGTLYDAWRAVAAATQLTFLLALPALTPAALVSLWREAAIHAAPLLKPADSAALRVLPWPEANQFTAAIAGADMATLVELRHWLAARLGWQPA